MSTKSILEIKAHSVIDLFFVDVLSVVVGSRPKVIYFVSTVPGSVGCRTCCLL